jgi:hypothetical protein
VDLYVSAYDDIRSHGRLFMNHGGKFAEASAEPDSLRASDHGVQWADIDGDGDLDLSLTETFPETARHRLFRNELPAPETGHSLEVLVLDRNGRATRAGAEVRLYSRKGDLVGTRLVPTGDGYGSQGATPVHFGLPDVDAVTVEVTFLGREGRLRQRFDHGLNAAAPGKPLVVREH